MEYNLARFINAQRDMYDTALAEIRGGRKLSHWIWYIFPQLVGLGHSGTAQYYGINGMDEARAYLAEPLLRARLIEISEALLALEGTDANAVFGYPDVLKVRSCMTLFAAVSGGLDNVFGQVLYKYYGGIADDRTLEMLGMDRL